MKGSDTFVLLVALAMSSTATAAITDVAGNITRIQAPTSVQVGALVSDTEIFAFKEVSKLTLTEPVFVNAIAPGFYDGTPIAATEFIPAGTIVDSYLLHFDPVGLRYSSIIISLGGTIRFSGNIIGVLFLADDLQASNIELGAPGTVYGSGGGFESPDNTDVRDFLTLAPDGKNITVLLNATGYYDEVRIITTHAPDPL